MQWVPFQTKDSHSWEKGPHSLQPSAINFLPIQKSHRDLLIKTLGPHRIVVAFPGAGGLPIPVPDATSAPLPTPGKCIPSLSFQQCHMTTPAQIP